MKQLSTVLVVLIGSFATGCTTSRTETSSVSDLDSIQHLIETAVDGSLENPDSSFERFLNFFSDVHPLNDWDTEALNPLVLKGEIHRSDQTDLRFALKFLYHRIPRPLLKHIPVEKIRHLDKRDPMPIKIPLDVFDFYGFAKEKRKDFWLVSIFAYKHTLEQNVYHQHPFILATYSNSGLLLDNFVWWSIIDDDIQVWDDVEVMGDTLMVGRKKEIYDFELDEVYGKVVLTENGRFRSVYPNFPQGYIRGN
jgi:hypothetical protein